MRLRIFRSVPTRLVWYSAPRSWNRATGSESSCQTMVRMERATATRALRTGLHGAWAQFGPRHQVLGGGKAGHVLPDSAMIVWAARRPTPVISSRRSIAVNRVGSVRITRSFLQRLGDGGLDGKRQNTPQK